jgi:sirohydrochlorin ferrochelatase
VRQQLAKQLLPLLGQNNVLDQAVMERREGAEFDFNGALLEDLLIRKAQQGVEQIIVLMQFLLPGRHAGEGGDVARICANIEQQFPQLRIQMTPLVAEHPALVEILHSRIDQALHTVANSDRQVQTNALFHAKIL